MFQFQKLLGLHISMPARDHTEEHRVATSLELLYDLVVVIAVASVASSLHHSIAENHIASGVLSFSMVFWPIFWAWMSFTWFASFYDPDDTPYRIAVFLQMLGYLILAAGVQRAFESNDFTAVMVGYTIMRISLVALWLRVIKSVPEDKIFALRYAIGTVLCQVAWIFLILVLPKSVVIGGFFILLTCEHLVPLYANTKRHSKWHHHHIIERYGLLSIIVLGESLLALTTTIQRIYEQYNLGLLSTLAGGLVILFSMWWMYFDQEDHPLLDYSVKAFIWGFSHVFIFASIASTGVGISVLTDYYAGQVQLSHNIAQLSVAISVALFVLFLWLLNDLPSDQNSKFKLLLPITGILVLFSTFIPHGILAIGIILTTSLFVRRNMKANLATG